MRPGHTHTRSYWQLWVTEGGFPFAYCGF